MKEILTWVWVVAASCGLLRSLSELRYAIHTKEELNEAGVNGVLHIVAESSSILEAIRSVIQALLLTAGLAILTGVAELSTPGGLVRWCIVLSVLLLWLKSEIAAHTRRRVLEDMNKERR